jgi:hypothetical protein
VPSGDDAVVPAGEEEVLAVARLPRWLVALVAVAAATAAAVLIARSGSGGQAAHTAHASPSAGTPYVYQPVPTPSTSAGLEECPPRVLCSVLDFAPLPLTDAIRARLADATLRAVHSVEYVAADQHREVVWFRRIVLRVADTDVVVVVHVPRSTDRESETAYRIGGLRGVRLQRVFFDRVVSLTLEGPGGGPTLGQLRAFAADVRLVAA